MSELVLSAKEVVLRLDRGMTTSFKVNAPAEFQGSAELRIYPVGSTDPVVIEADLETGDFIFDIDNTVSATLPAQGRYAVIWIDGEGEPHSLLKGQFYAEDIP